MEEKEVATIPFFVHEYDMARQERTNKRAIIALIIALVIVTAFAVAETVLRHVEHKQWLDYMDEYDFIGYEYSQDGEGVNIMGDNNGVDLNVSTLESEN